MMPIRIFGSQEMNLDVAMKAADKGADYLRKFIRTNRDLNIKYKGKNDLVTEADLQVESILKDHISKAFTDDKFLAEESSDDWILTNDRTWIIDPIDGTTNFAHGFPTYCISIALYENKQPQVGLIFEVSKGEMFTAVAGGGAYLNGRPITVSTINDPSASLIGTGFPYKDLGLLDEYLDLFKTLIRDTHGLRRPGSASYDLACVAAGRFDGFYEYGLSPWDIAAGILIVKEAGGHILDWKGGDNYLFGQRIIAGNKKISLYLLDQIEACFNEEHLEK